MKMNYLKYLIIAVLIPLFAWACCIISTALLFYSRNFIENPKCQNYSDTAVITQKFNQMKEKIESIKNQDSSIIRISIVDFINPDLGCKNKSVLRVDYSNSELKESSKLFFKDNFNTEDVEYNDYEGHFDDE